MIAYKATYHNRDRNHITTVKGKAQSMESARAEEAKIIASFNRMGRNIELVSVAKA